MFLWYSNSFRNADIVKQIQAVKYIKQDHQKNTNYKHFFSHWKHKWGFCLNNNRLNPNLLTELRHLSNRSLLFCKILSMYWRFTYFFSGSFQKYRLLFLLNLLNLNFLFNSLLRFLLSFLLSFFLSGLYLIWSGLNWLLFYLLFFYFNFTLLKLWILLKCWIDLNILLFNLLIFRFNLTYLGQLWDFIYTYFWKRQSFLSRFLLDCLTQFLVWKTSE